MIKPHHPDLFSISVLYREENIVINSTKELAEFLTPGLFDQQSVNRWILDFNCDPRAALISQQNLPEDKYSLEKRREAQIYVSQHMERQMEGRYGGEHLLLLFSNGGMEYSFFNPYYDGIVVENTDPAIDQLNYPEIYLKFPFTGAQLRIGVTGLLRTEGQ